MPDQENITKIVQSISWQNLLLIAVTAIAGFFLVRIVGKMLAGVMERTRLSKGVQNVICTVVRVVLWTLLVIIVTGSVGVDMTGMIAILSVVLLAISMSIQGVLGNVAGGVQVISTHPMAAGDFVKIGEISGTVKDVELAYTQLETPTGEMVHIPNSILASKEIINYTVLGRRRLDVTVGVSYENDPAQVKAVLMRLLAAQENVLHEPSEPAVLITDYGDSAIEYTMRAWTKPGDFWPVKCKLQEELYGALRANGISIPYPQVDVHMISQ